MDLKRIINITLVLMNCIMQMASQHLPSRKTFNGDLLYDDDYGIENMGNYFAPYRRVRQREKFIKVTGNNDKAQAPSEIAFDTYNIFGHPTWLRQENKYRPTKDQNWPQQAPTNPLINRYTKSSQEQQSQLSSSSRFKPIKDKGSKFVELLFPVDDTPNDAAEDENVSENLASATSSQYPLLRENDDGTADDILNSYFMQEFLKNDELMMRKRPRRTQQSYEQQTVDDDEFNAFKRQQAKSQSTQFLPSISAGVMTNLDHFFTDLTNNVQILRDRQLSTGEKQLLEGDHPVAMLKEELLRSVDGNPNGRFLNAIRTYQPSHRIRSLVAMNPKGYHGTQFLDPNYYYIGLG